MGALTLSARNLARILILSPNDWINLYDWTQATPGNGPVIETLGFRIKGRDTDEVAEVLQSIDEMIRLTHEYFSGNDIDPVWLNATLDGETYGRRALVYNITGGPNRTMMDKIFERSHRLNDYTLAIERAPYWEDKESTQVYHIAESMHTFDLDTWVSGDVSARISDLTIGAKDDATWAEAWIGFRSDRFGSHAAFQASCYFTGGYARVDTSIPGTYATCTFATPSMQERIYLRLDNWYGSETQYRGEYQVLLVASVGSGMEVDIKLRHGFYSDDENNSWITHDNRVRLTSTEPLIVDMGVVRFPFGRGTNTNAFMQGHAIGFDAELISGSGSLIFYRVILIPRSEGFIYIKAGYQDDSSDPSIGNGYANVITLPEGRIEGVLIDAYSVPKMTLELSTNNWSLPVGNVRVCWAAAGTEANGGYISSDRMTLGITYNQRWRTLKGTG